MQELVRQRLRQLLDDDLRRFAARQLLEGTFELAPAQCVGTSPQVLDHRDDAARLDPFLEVAHAGLDDRLGLRDGGLAALAAALDNATEVIHGVHVDVVEPRDLGFDVARHRKVDDEHRLAAA